MIGKKASITPIVVFVLLTLSISIATLLIFYFAEGEIKAGLYSPMPVLNLYAEREFLKVAVYEDFRQSIIESYNEVAKEQSQVSEMPICEEFGGKKVFCGVNPNLKTDFETDIKRRFLESLKIDDLKENLKEDGIEMSINVNNIELKSDSNFSLNIKNVTFVFTQEGEEINDIIAKYNFDISQEISLRDLGLVSFEDMHDKIRLCKPVNFSNCFKFEEFESSINNVKFGDREFYEVSMSSKQNFFVDGQLKPIEVQFLIVK